MSGSAHSLLWPHFGHDGTSIDSIDELGVGRVVVGGDASRLASDYFTAYHIAACGWRLFAQGAGRADIATPG